MGQPLSLDLRVRLLAAIDAGNGLWDLIGRLVDIFKPNECANYFTSCGYDPD